MSQSIGSAFKSIWHTMTSYDRHSSYDSPYRTGRHVPLNRQSTLTSVATASESRADITSPYTDEMGRLSTAVDGSSSYMGVGSHSSPLSPGSNGPYSPGLRSFNTKRNSSKDDGFETVSSPGEIPMQSFADGMPPAPPISHSWKRIDHWAEENYPELFDQLCEGCTHNDLNELEHQLDCSLPQDVRDSLMMHDGQERGGTPTGIIFSSMLLDCEEIVQEWDQWRKVNQEFLLETSVVKPAIPTKVLGGSNNNQASSSKSAPGSPAGSQTSSWRQDLLAKQDCVPPGAVQRAYAHSGWIPLVRDWGGNNLAVDLAPGPMGTWGQIIMFGRDYDIKYVVARSWSAFIALVADDLNSGKWSIDEETNELKLREFKTTRVEPSYFEILRWRMDQKYGRGARASAKRKSMVGSVASPTGSPYSGPVDGPGEVRGRSLQRLSSPSPLSSPIRPGYGKSSPLARVNEEGSGSASGPALPEPKLVTNGIKTTKLVEVDTPRPDDEVKSLPNGTDTGKGKENATLEAPAMNGNHAEGLEDAMKTIEI
ncbi:glucan synthesis regulatory protein [Pseudomassariella vexata]|uniref:Glucan synthesis regulatory protein n=1 Tax=Pseudomassariella vexata TaxID=1141098 RepID=A0A1Y2EK92_9PEZI|nr:glucan synthesis regulatory protein [Pseudomassariella vexata]ORY71736.1 glucan synthesis regulatory protein [Pseudomassariella vexata]